MQHELRVLKPEEYFIEDEPYYEPVGEEIGVFEAAYGNGLPVLLKGLKQSTRQRFVALEFDYPEAGLERRILERETGIAPDGARQLLKFAHMTRSLKEQGLDEGASTRRLVHAAKLMAAGIDPVTACRSSIAQALTDDPDMLSAVNELSASLF